MSLLRFLYFAIYSVSVSRDRSDLRFNPAAFVVMFVQPAIDSMLGVVLNLFTSRNPVVTDGTTLYERFDLWTYVSVALATIFSWLCFDKKRTEILAEYDQSSCGQKVLIGIIALAFIYILVEIYLYTFNYVLAVICFFAVLILGNYWVADKVLKREG